MNLTPDTYVPSIDIHGNYVDNVPVIRHGMYCPCGTRKDLLYKNTSCFVSHTKTKSHQKWLTFLNLNKANHFVELSKMKELVENQQKIIAKMEIEFSKKDATIHYLTEQLIKSSSFNPSPNIPLLLDLLD